MPRNGVGFGRDGFGVAPFGESWVTRRILWEMVPEYDKRLDAESGGALQAFMLAVSDLVGVARRGVRAMSGLRDADTLRTKWSQAVAVVEADLLLFRVPGDAYVSATIPLTVDLSLVSSAWTVDTGAVQYRVKSVSKLDGVVEFFADEIPALPFTLRAPDMLRHLASDYGAIFDGHEPDALQRSSVSDHHKLLDLKGTKAGVEVRAMMAGFSATVQPLFRLSSGALESLVGSDHFFEIPVDSGKFYTDVAPSVPLYDAAPADSIPADRYVSSVEISDKLDDVTGEPGEWVCTFTANVPHVVSGWWYFTLDDDPSQERYYASPGEGLNPDQVIVLSQTQPIAGDVTWRLYSPVVTSCDWCRSHLVRVDLQVVDPRLLESPRALELAFQRMSAKVSQMLPAHVRVAQYVFTTPSSAVAEFAATSESVVLDFSKYDADAADVHPADEFEET